MRTKIFSIVNIVFMICSIVGIIFSVAENNWSSEIVAILCFIMCQNNLILVEEDFNNGNN